MKQEEQSLVISPQSVKVTKVISSLVETAVEKSSKEYLFWFITVVLTASLGAIISLVIDLNSKISEVVGKTQYPNVEYIKILQNRVIQLEKERIVLQDNLFNEKTNKLNSIMK